MSETPINASKLSVLQRILNRDSIEFAVLYGSQATGDSTPESDIDIGIMFSSDTSVDPYTVIFRIEEEYVDEGFDDMELDLSVLNTATDESFLSTVKMQAIHIAGDEHKSECFANSTSS